MNIDKLSNDVDFDLDLSNLKIILKKYTGIILVSTFVASSVGYVRGKNMPKIWQGQFQIVLGGINKGSSSNNLESNLRSLLGKKNSSTDLNTQLAIMKSPLILIPAYEKILNSEKFKSLNIEEFSFSEIQSKLKSKFKDGTKVLDISYSDTRKDLIPIVLEEISKTYQIYSYRDIESSLDKGMKYLNKQISVYDEKLTKSVNELQKYSKKYDLSFRLDGENIIINTEVFRVESSEKIRLINKRINLLQSIDNKEEFIYIAEIYNPNSDILEKIQEIENKIIVNQTLYKSGDQLIKLLKARKNDLYDSLRSDLLAFLKSEKKALQAQVNSSNRPIKVLTEYSRLVRNNIRTRKLIAKFEKNKNELVLELAKSKDPWEIITKPKLLDWPIGPDRKRILFIHAFFGFFGSLITFLILELRKGKVLTSSECEKTLGIPILLELSSMKNDKYWEESLNLLFNSYLNFEDDQKVAICFLGDKNEELFQKFSLKLKNLFKNKYLITDDLLEAKDYNKQIILIVLGSTSKLELSDFKSKIKLQRKETLGFIALNN